MKTNATPTFLRTASPDRDETYKAWDAVRFSVSDLGETRASLDKRVTALTLAMDDLYAHNGESENTPGDEAIDLLVLERLVDRVDYWVRVCTENVAEIRERAAKIRTLNAERTEVAL